MRKALWRLANTTVGKHRNIVHTRIAKELKALHPLHEKQTIVEAYYIRKVYTIFLIIILVIIVVLLLYIQSCLEVNLKNGNQILRNAYGEGAKIVTVWAQKDHSQEKYRVEMEIQERKYKGEELVRLFEQGVEELDMLVLGENQTLDRVTHNLQFVKTLQNAMLQVEWDLESYEYLNADGGLIYKNVPQEGILVRICAKLVYFDTSYEHLFYAKVYLPKKMNEELWVETLQETIEKNEEKTKYQTDVILPDVIEDTKVSWKYEKSQTTIVILILGIVLIVGIYWGKDQEIHRQYTKRNLQLLLDYSEIISKLLLLLGAGMTVLGAWNKIVEGYNKKRKTGSGYRRYAYDELVVTLHEIQSGVSEIEAYDNYGKRCKNQKYVKFMTLLVQSIRKGGGGLRELLEYEVKEAFQERKNVAKKMGEEASTKLLGPMMMMLVIVLIMIIVPACMSFQF